MDTKRFTLDTTLTLVAAYLGLFVGLIDANAVNLALPAIRDDLGGGISGALARKRAILDEVADVRVLPTTPTTRGFDPDGVRIDWKVG